MCASRRAHKGAQRPALRDCDGRCTPAIEAGMLARQGEGTIRMSLEASIRSKLSKALAPERLEVINESHLHAGHRDAPGTGESHFRVLVVSAAFAGKSRLARHRLVNEVLAAELAGKVHALALDLQAPGESSGG
jgi:BolA protein